MLLLYTERETDRQTHARAHTHTHTHAAVMGSIDLGQTRQLHRQKHQTYFDIKFGQLGSRLEELDGGDASHTVADDHS